MAFNSKNLQYEKKEPAFLRKLRGEFGGLDGRHNVQIARPKKDRLKTGDEDEDDPVIVDEQGERVEKAEFERRVREGGDEDGKERRAGDGDDAEKSNTHQGSGEKHGDRQKVAGIGVPAHSKKRKAGKAVGVDNEAVDDRDEEAPLRKTSSNDGGCEGETKAPTKKKEPGAGKKKAKKIKLSFDDTDG